MKRRTIVSFPKSGRSWLRYALELADQNNSIKFTHDGFEYNDGKKPSLNFQIEKRRSYYPSNVDKLVYIERDPRDTIVSLYFQITGRFKDYFDYSGTISDFIRDHYFGVENLVRFQLMWRILVFEHKWMTVKYEDLHADFQSTFSKICHYLDIDISKKEILDIKELASFDNMRELELSYKSGRPWLTPRNGAFKVRMGKVGGYRAELSSEDINYINKIMSHYKLV